MTAGYSGTPLARKLSLRDGQRVWFDEMPPSVREEIDEAGLKLHLLSAPEKPIDAAHIFVTDRAGLEEKVTMLRPLLASAGFIWVSWPKKASGVVTDISEDRIRDVILSGTELVDVKVCAIDNVWSGLKLMIRLAHR